LAAYELLRPD